MWDWNLNFLKDSTQLRAVQNLLTMNNLVNTITDPTRYTKNSIALLDVMITDKSHYNSGSEVVDLGYSDHLAQILHVKVEKLKSGQRKVIRRQMSSRNIEEFNNLLKTETWEEVLVHDDVNISITNF